MEKELKVTEERVKDAAASCSTAKQVLEKLFPEVFKVGFAEKDFELRKIFYYGEDTITLYHIPSRNYIVGIGLKTGKIIRFSGVNYEGFQVEGMGEVKIKDRNS